MSKGVVYVATGKKYVNEAKKSAKSVSNNLDKNLVLFTDNANHQNDEVFDKTVVLNNAAKKSGDKIKCMKKSPFDKTLFLDADTYVCSDISRIFDLLERFDIAAPYAPNRVNEEALEDIPDTFPEVNTGVVLYRRCNRVKKFFDEWERRYKIHQKNGMTIDQSSFRESLYYEDVKHHILPPEYNMRFENVSVGFASGRVKILHGRRSEKVLKEFSKKINNDENNRIWEIEGGTMSVINDVETVLRRVKTNLKLSDIKNKIKKEYKNIT
jgi:hypothetical protein